ncbi:FAD/NAD(P)-binding domain-containing protein [Penicillium viridicatum]|nr:FAD/NAD(P)-binding domain-containing protein [Penicillium viridicatum]
MGWSRPFLVELLPEHLVSQLNMCLVDPTVDCASIGEDRVVIWNGKTRELVWAFPMPNAQEVNIRNIRLLLSKELDVHYSKALAYYELIPSGGVRVFFTDGTSDEGDVLIGMDGASSSVRQNLLGHAATPELLPFAMMNFNVSYTDEQAKYIKGKIHPLIDVALHPAGRYLRTNVLDVPDNNDGSTWTYQILTTWPIRNIEDYENPESTRLQRLKEHIRKEDWAEPYKSAIEWIPDDTHIPRDFLKTWSPVKWNNHDGRITIGGDAAHAMTFYRGQGGNNALYDAYCFVEAMKAVKAGKPLKDVVDEYDAKLFDRGYKEVEISKAQAFYVHDLDTYEQSPAVKYGTRPSHDAKSSGYDGGLVPQLGTGFGFT